VTWDPSDAHLVQIDPACRGFPFSSAEVRQGWLVPGAPDGGLDFRDDPDWFGLGSSSINGRELSVDGQVIGIMIDLVVIGLLSTKSFFSRSKSFFIAVGGTSQA